MKIARNFTNTLCVMLFFCAISFPLLDSFCHLDTTPELNEKRTLAAKPSLVGDWESLRAFPKQFEAYYNDHFGFRKRLIHLLALFRLNVLGVSPNRERVTLGKEEWMFYNPSLDEEMPDKVCFDDAHLAAAQAYFENWHNRLAAQGIAYFLVIAPDKKDVYDEYLPHKYARKDPLSWQSNKFIQYMKANSKIPLIDLAPVLRSQKELGPLYLKTDSHWNELGGFLASETIMDAVHKEIPAVRPPLPISACNIKKTANTKGGDIAKIIGLLNEVAESNRVEVTLKEGAQAKRITNADTIEEGAKCPPFVYEAPHKELPRAVIFHDSFGYRMFPYLSEHFSRSVYYAQYYGQQTILDFEKPDVVIHEVVARKARILHLLPDAKW